MPTIDQCFERMKSNKKVRISMKRKEAIAKVMNYTTAMVGQWFYITAIHCDNTLTLCSTGHFIMEGESINDVLF